MLTASSNPLLNDLEADYHAYLLEKGNLVKRPPAVSWSDENSWRSQGYEAHIQTSLCACEAITSTLTGIFHVETTPSGKRRALALSPKAQIPLGQGYPIIETLVETLHCAHCIPFKGFTREH